MPTVRNHLSDATAALHHQVDAAFDLERITTPRGYAAMLLAHGAVVPAVERHIAASPCFARLPAGDTRLRSAALREDLEALGLRQPAPIDMSFLISPGGIAGLLYVLEGSRLGATVICRRLVQSGANLPTSFLRHGEGLGLWASFLEWLHGTSWTGQDLIDMRANAVELFRQYIETAETQFSAS